MDDEDWTAPFTYKALGEYAVTSHGAEHPYYVRNAVNWEKAARAMAAERDAALADAARLRAAIEDHKAARWDDYRDRTLWDVLDATSVRPADPK